MKKTKIQGGGKKLAGGDGKSILKGKEGPPELRNHRSGRAGKKKPTCASNRYIEPYNVHPAARVEKDGGTKGCDFKLTNMFEKEREKWLSKHKARQDRAKVSRF